jgi:DNA-binding XRE family transcriptional regulator
MPRKTMNKQGFVSARVHTEVPPGEALKILRELQGMSQNELAVASGISQANISVIENGRVALGWDKSMSLAEPFGAPCCMVVSRL